MILIKRGYDTLDALSELAHLFKLKYKSFMCAGMKDKRGITT